LDEVAGDGVELGAVGGHVRGLNALHVLADLVGRHRDVDVRFPQKCLADGHVHGVELGLGLLPEEVGDAPGLFDPVVEGPADLVDLGLGVGDDQDPFAGLDLQGPGDGDFGGLRKGRVGEGGGDEHGLP